MKIASITSMKYDHVLQQLPVGIMLINKDDRIEFANAMARELCELANDNDLQSLSEIIDHPATINVKQLHQHVESIDTIKINQQKVLSVYRPFFSEQGTLMGIILMFESLHTFDKQVREFTDKKMLESIIEESMKHHHYDFRVVMPDKTEWFVSQKWQQLSKKEKQWVDLLATKAINARREISDRVQVSSNRGGSLEIICKPLWNHGKIAGCMQFVNKSSEQETDEELTIARQLIRKLESSYRMSDIIAVSPAMNIAKEQAKLYAKMHTPIMIKGEVGTGKQMMARAIHDLSEWRDYPFYFIRFSELQNAITKKLPIKQKGTYYIYMDSKLTQDRQEQLLEIMTKQHHIRIIFGTATAIHATDWLDGLYDMLQRYVMVLPNLKERSEDFQPLIMSIINMLNQKYQKNVSAIDDHLLTHWIKQDWPGNVMQLERTLEKQVLRVSFGTEVLTLDQLEQADIDSPVPSVTFQNRSLQEAIDQFEKDYIFSALKQNQFNKSKTARELGVSVRNLYYKMEKYNMERGANS
ncbi:sigma 54-interacting transcriptional regulator [Gracilibacillus caseinilyticus]|uniref:Sigma 54-interacting transcriptional regulator n=1 Tax=Gracilibacillus caseinilyticus TaxID=2932256 RepID=A0ABY4EUF6_9BACI|nr:helix-turn-helix domain-containing protein [Gracilibacillus caseinilyticus]UOQ47502.1 sigma 54-interacting transcriptional regulator [Gracilibacillus caseinilyticus]